MTMHPAAARCPVCDKRVTVQPSVKSVEYGAGKVTVTFNQAAVDHHCGEPPTRMGFGPRGGSREPS